MDPHPIIALLTDFGSADGYPGTMKGVILGIASGATLVDLTHEVPPQDVATGAWLLHTAWRFFPAGVIFLCVVDPGVGSERRAVALSAGGRYFVGPDNGLFSYMYAAVSLDAAVALDDPRYQLPNPSATFHGRDIFAPGAAHLAAGVPLAALGSSLDPETLVRLPLPHPERRGDTLAAHVLYVDRFGNLITDLDPDLTDAILADAAVRVEIVGVPITARAATFADAPLDAPALLRDSSGHLALAVREGSAATLLGATRGAEVLVSGVWFAESQLSSPPGA
jgi:S-adenosylmethionine hydrolase